MESQKPTGTKSAAEEMLKKLSEMITGSEVEEMFHKLNSMNKLIYNPNKKPLGALNSDADLNNNNINQWHKILAQKKNITSCYALLYPNCRTQHQIWSNQNPPTNWGEEYDKYYKEYTELMEQIKTFEGQLKESDKTQLQTCFQYPSADNIPYNTTYQEQIPILKEDLEEFTKRVFLYKRALTNLVNICNYMVDNEVHKHIESLSYPQLCVYLTFISNIVGLCKYVLYTPKESDKDKDNYIGLLQLNNGLLIKDFSDFKPEDNNPETLYERLENKAKQITTEYYQMINQEPEHKTLEGYKTTRLNLSNNFKRFYKKHVDKECPDDIEKISKECIGHIYCQTYTDKIIALDKKIVNLTHIPIPEFHQQLDALYIPPEIPSRNPETNLWNSETHLWKPFFQALNDLEKQTKMHPMWNDTFNPWFEDLINNKRKGCLDQCISKLDHCKRHPGNYPQITYELPDYQDLETVLSPEEFEPISVLIKKIKGCFNHDDNYYTKPEKQKTEHQNKHKVVDTLTVKTPEMLPVKTTETLNIDSNTNSEGCSTYCTWPFVCMYVFFLGLVSVLITVLMKQNTLKVKKSTKVLPT